MGRMDPLSPEEDALRAAEGLSVPQYKIFTCPSKFRLVICGRRFGKTNLIIREVIRAAQVDFKQNVAVVSPTLKMSKKNIWRDLLEAIPHDMIAQKNETTLWLKLKNYESTIQLFGAENNGDSIRGSGFHFAALDEICDFTKESFESAILPALADKNGEAILCGTPKNGWVEDLKHAAEDPENKNWSYFEFTTREGGNVSEEFIEMMRKQMSPTRFSQEFEAKFQNAAGLIYHEFNRAIHVSKEAEDDGGPLILSSDQNVFPYVCLHANIKQIDGRRVLHVFRETVLAPGHTLMLIDELKNLYMKPGSGRWDRDITMSPDPASRGRHTSGGGKSDIVQFREAGLRLAVPSKTKVKDKINCLQRMFKDADGASSILINPRCVELIKALSRWSYKTGTDDPEKGEWDHAPDALGYMALAHFPIRRFAAGMSRLSGV